jgi:hypothetical protein
MWFEREREREIHHEWRALALRAAINSGKVQTSLHHGLVAVWSPLRQSVRSSGLDGGVEVFPTFLQETKYYDLVKR